MRRVSILALVFVAAILSCGKDVTGPLGAAARYVRGLAFNPVFPPAFQVSGGSSVVQFSNVHVVLHHSDGTVALDTIINFPSGTDSLTVDLTVKLLDNSPTTGEPMTLNLGYLNAAGDVVFSGGPVSVTAAPPATPGVPNPPVQVPVIYTGPGATAVSVSVSPHSQTVLAGGTFAFSASAKDASGKCDRRAHHLELARSHPSRPSPPQPQAMALPDSRAAPRAFKRSCSPAELTSVP